MPVPLPPELQNSQIKKRLQQYVEMDDKPSFVNYWREHTAGSIDAGCAFFDVCKMALRNLRLQPRPNDTLHTLWGWTKLMRRFLQRVSSRKLERTDRMTLDEEFRRWRDRRQAEEAAS